MDRPVGREGLRPGGLVARSLEGSAAAGEPVPGAVLEEDPVLAAVAIEAKHQRVRRAPAARSLMKPTEQRAARAVVDLCRDLSFGATRREFLARRGGYGVGREPTDRNVAAPRLQSGGAAS